MKTSAWKHTGAVFAQTFKTQVKSKLWWVSTLLVAAILIFLIPTIIFFLARADGGTEITLGVIVDELGGGAVDYTALTDSTETVEYVTATDLDSAMAQVAEQPTAVVFRLTWAQDLDEDAVHLAALLPEDSEISRSDATKVGEQIAAQLPTLLLQKTDLTAEEVALLSADIRTELIQSGEGDDQELTELLTELLPILLAVVLMMMVLSYAQAATNSVLLEKHNRLTESLLIAIDPTALLTGKLFGVLAAGVLQAVIWTAASFLGTVLAVVAYVYFMLTGQMDGDAMTQVSGMGAQSLDTATTERLLTKYLGMLSPMGLFLGLLILIAGFLLYLALAMIGGSLGTKNEDVNQASYLFAWPLGASLLAISSNLSDVGAVTIPLWQQLLPFTAVLVDPGALFLGAIPLRNGVSALILTLLLAALVMRLMGALYRATLFYRGGFLTWKKTIRLLKNEKKSGKDKD